MSGKPTYEELEQKVADLESELAKHKAEKTVEFKRLADRSKDAIYHYDLKLRRYLYLSRSFMDFFGLEEVDEKKLTSKTVLLHIHPEDWKRLRKAARDSLTPGCMSGEVECRFLHRDGSIRWIRDRWIVIRNRHGEPVAFEGIVRDETEHKRIEDELKREKEKFQVLVEGSPLGVSLIGKDRRYKYINPKFVEIFGHTIEDIPTGKEWFRKAYPDKEYREQVISTWINDQKDSEIGEARPRTFHVICKNGTEKVIHFRPVTLENEDQLVIYEDITTRTRLEEQFQHAQKMEAIGILAGGIAHDFNNLLSVILGNISLIKDEVGVEYMVSEFLNDAEKATLGARDLTHQLITFSKGGAPVRRKASISEVLMNSAKLALSGSNVRCEFNIPEALWPVEFDEAQMKQAINNIMKNAEESMPDGNTIEVRAENLAVKEVKQKADLSLPEGNYVKISIQDQGVGIPEKNLPLIFDPYFSTKEMGVQKGMGLGLAVVYSIITKHDGHITVDSTPGIGTTFHIYLPAAVKKIMAKKKKKEKIAGAKLKVLVMDDEEAIRKLADQMLDRLGYQAELARDGTEAIEIYKAANKSGDPFDAVILDLTVKGGMGGREAIKRLIDIDPDVRAIISSGYFNDPVMSNFNEYGFCSFIAKPYGIRQLSDVLDKVLDRKQNGSGHKQIDDIE